MTLTNLYYPPSLLKFLLLKNPPYSQNLFIYVNENHTFDRDLSLSTDLSLKMETLGVFEVVYFELTMEIPKFYLLLIELLLVFVILELLGF